MLICFSHFIDFIKDGNSGALSPFLISFAYQSFDGNYLAINNILSDKPSNSSDCDVGCGVLFIPKIPKLNFQIQVTNDKHA